MVPYRAKAQGKAADVSIIIPTRNRANLLPVTVASARAAGSSVEVIVVDDASTDLTEQVCRSIRDITYIRLPQQVGTAEARNVGIRASRRDFLAFLDDDDMRLPGTIDRQLELLKRTPGAALICARAFFGDSRYSLPTGWVVPPEAHSGDVFWQLLDGNFIQLPSVVARREALIERGLFDARLTMLEDYDLWVRLAEVYPIAFLDEPVAVIRERSHGSGQKTSDRAVHDREHGALHRGWLRLPRARAATRFARWRIHRRHMRMIYNSLVSDAAKGLLDGHVQSARAYLWAAVRMSPLHPKAHGSLLWLLLRQRALRYGDAVGSGRRPRRQAGVA